VRQASSRSELLLRPASESVARILGFRNILSGAVVESGQDGLHVEWRGQRLEFLPPADLVTLLAPGKPLSFFVRPEDLRLIRKDGPSPDRTHHTNILSGRVVRETDRGIAWTLMLRLDAPGQPAQGDFDVEIDIPRFVYEMLHIDRERTWQFSIHRGSLHILSC
jgi:ABC-type Fe3+/spermidine/putrescine transport system ATPase subunit